MAQTIFCVDMFGHIRRTLAVDRNPHHLPSVVRRSRIWYYRVTHSIWVKLNGLGIRSMSRRRSFARRITYSDVYYEKVNGTLTKCVDVWFPDGSTVVARMVVVQRF